MVVVERSDGRSTLEGCYNFRELGGFLTADGSRLAAGRLFRSDSLAAASVADRRILAAPDVATVIDLRSCSEVERGSRIDPKAVVRHLPLANPLHGIAPRDWDDPHRVAARYLELLLDGTDTVAETLAVLTDPVAYPAVIHCSAGKDRTGIVVAVLLALVGVSDDDIVTDYTLSGMATARLVVRLVPRAIGDDDLVTMRARKPVDVFAF